MKKVRKNKTPKTLETKIREGRERNKRIEIKREERAKRLLKK